MATVAAQVGTAVRTRTYGSPERSIKIPSMVRRRLRLDPPLPGARRVEIGSGFRPSPGVIHVDVVRRPHVEFVSPGDKLPFADGWVEELMAVHMLEHVPPPRVRATLAEWHRVLGRGGRLEVHVPNGEALSRALLEHPDDMWAIQGAIFGYGTGPEAGQPGDLIGEPGHRTLWVFELLLDTLRTAGFDDVRDVSTERRCHHARYWSATLPDLCLEVTARKT